jgi:hypothetical protein
MEEEDEDNSAKNNNKFNIKEIDDNIKVNLKELMEDSGPINLAELKISMPQLKDDLQETTSYFE